MKTTLTDLKDLSAYWQERLGLQEWKINVEFVSPWAFSVLGRCGQVDWDLDFMTATIKIMDEKFRTAEVPNTVEGDLIHELVHIVLSRCKFDTEMDEERAVIKLQRALMKGEKKN